MRPWTVAALAATLCFVLPAAAAHGLPAAGASAKCKGTTVPVRVGKKIT